MLIASIIFARYYLYMVSEEIITGELSIINNAKGYNALIILLI